MNSRLVRLVAITMALAISLPLKAKTVVQPIPNEHRSVVVTTHPRPIHRHHHFRNWWLRHHAHRHHHSHSRIHIHHRHYRHHPKHPLKHP